MRGLADEGALFQCSQGGVQVEQRAKTNGSSNREHNVALATIAIAQSICPREAILEVQRAAIASVSWFLEDDSREMMTSK